MRSAVPLPGNPWPHDMVITVENDPHSLVDLLWIRETWNLHPVATDLPPLFWHDSVRTHAMTEPSGGPKTWSDSRPFRDATAVEQLYETTDGPPERGELLQAMMGPSWRDEMGDEAIAEEYETWNLARFEAQARRQPLSLDEEPGRMSLNALVPAWRAGLSTVLIHPCHGSYTRRIGEHVLLVTDETRNDPTRYAEPLEQFR